MDDKKEKKTFFSLMEAAGITVNGDKPYDIQVHDDKFFERVLHQTALGLGESYMDRWWECKSLDWFIEKILRADLLSKIKQDWTTAWNIFKAKIFNLQNTRRAFMVGKEHYDIGNDLYQKMLAKNVILNLKRNIQGDLMYVYLPTFMQILPVWLWPKGKA